MITGILWAQTDFDTLILKDGTTYFGEYSKIEEKIVYFKPQGVGAIQRVPVKQIQTLKLKDGHFIIGDGRNRLTLEEYQKIALQCVQLFLSRIPTLCFVRCRVKL